MNHEIVLNTCMLIMEQMNEFEPEMLSPLSPQTYDLFITILGFQSKYLVRMLEEPLDSPAREEFIYANLLAANKFIATISKFFPEPAMISSIEIEGNSFAKIVYCFLSVLDSISSQLTNQENQILEEYYSNYIRNLFPERTTTVLHVAMNGPWYNDIPLDTIKLTLKLGGDPNAIDENGGTALHILAGINFLYFDKYMPVFRALVDAGCHLDMSRDDGDTVLSILKKKVKECKRREFFVHPYYESQISTVFPLTCYCARVIGRHGIRFDEDRLPPPLQRLVALHSAR